MTPITDLPAPETTTEPPTPVTCLIQHLGIITLMEDAFGEENCSPDSSNSEDTQIFICAACPTPGYYTTKIEYYATIPDVAVEPCPSYINYYSTYPDMSSFAFDCFEGYDGPEGDSCTGYLALPEYLGWVKGVIKDPPVPTSDMHSTQSIGVEFSCYNSRLDGSTSEAPSSSYYPSLAPYGNPTESPEPSSSVTTTTEPPTPVTTEMTPITDLPAPETTTEPPTPVTCLIQHLGIITLMEDAFGEENCSPDSSNSEDTQIFICAACPTPGYYTTKLEYYATIPEDGVEPCPRDFYYYSTYSHMSSVNFECFEGLFYGGALSCSGYHALDEYLGWVKGDIENPPVPISDIESSNSDSQFSCYENQVML